MTDALLFVLTIALVLVVACFVVPIVAKRVVERDAERGEGAWIHEHIPHARRDPKPRHPSGREPESEGER